VVLLSLLALINLRLIKCSKTCEVTYERITEGEDEDKDNSLSTGTASQLLDCVETKKRKRDVSNDLDLKRAFRRLTLTSKAPWLDLKNPVYYFEGPQDIDVEADMDDSSASDAETPNSEDFELAYDDNPMMFGWPDREETTVPDSMDIDAPESEDVGLPPIQTIQCTHYAPKRPLGPILTGNIWTCVKSQTVLT